MYKILHYLIINTLWKIICVIALCIIFISKFLFTSQETQLPLTTREFNISYQPPYHSEKGMLLYEEQGWEVYQHFPSGHLEVFLNTDRITLPSDWRRDMHVMKVLSSKESLLFIVYDNVKNFASGRAVTTQVSGLDIYKLSSASKEIELLNAGIEGGIDSSIHAYFFDDNLLLCIDQRCSSIDAESGNLEKWENGLSGYDLLEVVFQTENIAHAIVRKTWDDRYQGELTSEFSDYFLATIHKKKGASLKKIPENEIPFGLTIQDNKPVYNVIDSLDKIEKLFLYEISRMRHYGLMSYGENNLEGRIAWDAVYYLNGFISLVQTNPDWLSEHVRQEFIHRINSEIEWIIRLADTDYPNYRVKRYSVNREPLLFALHLGRIANLLNRAEPIFLNKEQLGSALTKIQNQLLTLENTVEEKINCEQKLQDCITLAYRKGFPFWADGINVPFNFISGYMSGLLTIDSAIASELSEQLIKPLLVLENLSSKSDLTDWRYWWGIGDNGWNRSQYLSMNTLEWTGNKGSIAHITYRSMDAEALIKLSYKKPNIVGHETVERLKKLISEGWLLPSVNEAFFDHNEQRAILNANVIRRFSRSTYSYEIQSQVWALNNLSEKIKTSLSDK